MITYIVRDLKRGIILYKGYSENDARKIAFANFTLGRIC
jgi:hypothetical protein